MKTYKYVISGIIAGFLTGLIIYSLEKKVFFEYLIPSGIIVGLICKMLE